jgi:hypothetical protein
MRNQIGSNRFAAFLASACVFLLGSSHLVHADVFSDIDPKSETITCGGNTLGTLTINQYAANNPGKNGPGATMEATFTQTDTDCDLKLEWIQVVVSGSGTIGQDDVAAYNKANPGANVPSPFPYLDPYERDDNLPYYWKTDENSTVGDGKSAAGAPAGNHFFDAPSEGPAALIKNDNIHFETALVSVDCTDPTELHWLAGFTWGYTINGDGTMSTADKFNWLGTYSADMNTAVTAFDGTQNYVGDKNGTKSNNAGKSAGYKFVGGCPTCCCTVPLPNSAEMTLVGMAGLGMMIGVRSKFAKAA